MYYGIYLALFGIVLGFPCFINWNENLRNKFKPGDLLFLASKESWESQPIYKVLECGKRKYRLHSLSSNIEITIDKWVINSIYKKQS